MPPRDVFGQPNNADDDHDHQHPADALAQQHNEKQQPPQPPNKMVDGGAVSKVGGMNSPKDKNRIIN